MISVTLLGAGNLATRLAFALLESSGISIRQIYSRTEEHARSLAARIACCYTTDPSTIEPGSDFYIFALKDSALEEVASQVPTNKGLWLHTSGSMSIDVLKPYTSRPGVLYPLQTFSKDRDVEFFEIPIFVEATNKEDLLALLRLGDKLSRNVRFLPSDKRRLLHLAAVFACNFTNHLYTLAGDILDEAELPFDVLLPLIDETAAKIHELTPYEAQTGPAVRFDENVIQKHLDLLDDPRKKDLYLRLSQSIHQDYTQP